MIFHAHIHVLGVTIQDDSWSVIVSNAIKGEHLGSAKGNQLITFCAFDCYTRIFLYSPLQYREFSCGEIHTENLSEIYHFLLSCEFLAFTSINSAFYFSHEILDFACFYHEIHYTFFHFRHYQFIIFLKQYLQFYFKLKFFILQNISLSLLKINIRSLTAFPFTKFIDYDILIFYVEICLKR